MCTAMAGGGGREREREREREGERERKRTVFKFIFINEGNEISTILFYIQPSGKKQQQKTIENKIIIN